MSARLRDREIEQLLTRSPLARDDLGDLEGFVAILSSEQTAPGDVISMASSLAAVARSTGRPRRQPLRRLSLATALVFLLMLFSGVALAADGAGPGNPLYRIDQALEKIGIGAGGAEERLEELKRLLERGYTTEAFEFLEQIIGEAGLGLTQEDVQNAAAASNAPVEVQQKVADLHEFITGNRGKDRGVDGADFGQGVAEIASSNGAENSSNNQAGSPPSHAGETGRPEHSGVPGQPDHAESNQSPNEEEEEEAVDVPEDESEASDTADSEGMTPPASTPAPPAHAATTGPPDHAQPNTDHETGPPDHAQPNNDREPGPPDHAGPKDKP